MDGNNALNRLLDIDTLNRILGLHIHQDRIPRIRNLVAQALDLAKRCLQTIPLGGKAVSAGRDGERISERCIVTPEREFLERGPSGEEVEHGAYDGLLLFRERDAGACLDVCCLDVEG